LYSKNDSDLMSGMWKILRNINIEIHHIKCHQGEAGEVLSHEEKFNVLADELASCELREYNTEESTNHMRNGPKLEISGRTITSNFVKEL
jgi:hypothetical protein